MNAVVDHLMRNIRCFIYAVILQAILNSTTNNHNRFIDLFAAFFVYFHHTFRFDGNYKFECMTSVEHIAEYKLFSFLTRTSNCMNCSLI